MKIRANKRLLSLLLAGGITFQLCGCANFKIRSIENHESSLEESIEEYIDTPSVYKDENVEESFDVDVLTPEESSLDESVEEEVSYEFASGDFSLEIISDEIVSDELSDIDDDASMEEDPVLYELLTGICVNSPVNVRSGPSTDYDIIGGLTPGSKFELISHDDHWYQIHFYGESAYIYDEYADICSYIDGIPLKIVCFPRDVSFTTLEGEEKTLPYCEVGLVYEIKDNQYLISSDHELGYVSIDDCIELDGVFAIIDKSNQRIDVYRDNELLLSSPCVTGKDSSPTDTGLHEIWFINHNTYLTGPGYSSYVNHFLAFNGGEGLHDASWRSIFGTNDYHTDGSHGCVNLPIPVAEEINNTMTYNDKVLVKE